jgi:hypothetical protein
MDMAQLKKVVVYDGYRPADDTITIFWEVRGVDVLDRVLLFSGAR